MEQSLITKNYIERLKGDSKKQKGSCHYKKVKLVFLSALQSRDLTRGLCPLLSALYSHFLGW